MAPHLCIDHSLGRKGAQEHWSSLGDWPSGAGVKTCMKASCGAGVMMVLWRKVPLISAVAAACGSGAGGKLMITGWQVHGCRRWMHPYGHGTRHIQGTWP